MRALISTMICLSVLAASCDTFFPKRKTSGLVSKSDVVKLGIERPEKVIRAPDFALEDLSGKRWNLRDWRGKVIFLNFWATWCVPCREEMPTMEMLHREFRQQGLEVVAINFREGEKEVRGFVEELGLTITVLLDRDGKVAEEYGAWAIPLSYFISREGEFVGKVKGYRKWDSPEARAFFQGLLREKN